TTWFAIDASYNRLHLDTLNGLAYFANTPVRLVTGSSSYYVSNIHSANLAAHFSIGKRVDLSSGFSIVQDVGLDQACNAAVSNGLCVAPPTTSTPTNIPTIFAGAQTFPLRYLSPQTKVSFRIREKLRWNTGYQHYAYREDVSNLQNF